MGYWKIFWVNEGVIRSELRNNFGHLIEGGNKAASSSPARDYSKTEDRELLFAPIGKTIVSISLGYGRSEPSSVSFRGSGNIFNHTCSLHSSHDDGFFLFWAGTRLIPLRKAFFDSAGLRSLIELEEIALDHGACSLPLSDQQRFRGNLANPNADYGIYCISEDDTRRHKEVDDSVIGESFLNLMLANWSDRSGSVRRVCSMVGIQFRFFIFAGNTLSTLKYVDQDPYFDYLKKM